MNKCELSIADESFFDTFFKIKSEPLNLYWTGHDKKPNYDKLKAWYREQLKKDSRIFFKIVYNDNDVGYLYFDILDDQVIELSYAILKKYQKLGITSCAVEKAIKYAIKKYPGYAIKAYVANTNMASRRIMDKHLFKKTPFTYKQVLKKTNEEVTMEEYVYRKTKKVFIIAEAGVNHNGDIGLAKKLIDVAVDAGADAVKFQTWKTELLVTQNAKQAAYQIENTAIKESQYDMLKKLELSYNDFINLKAYCDNKGILFLSTPDEPTSADFLRNLQDIIKIGSGELTNIPYLKYLGAFKQKVILSTGMGNLGEIEKALTTLVAAGTKKENITLLHATTMYPTPMHEVNLNAMLTIKQAFQTEVGYSDHTMGIEVPVAAVALGATVIEKHFTLNRNMEGPDHKASLMPKELKNMVQAIRNIESALGTGEKIAQASETGNKNIVRKTIVAKQPILKGELFSEENLTTKRVGEGINAILWEEIIGLTSRYDFQIDEPIRL